MAAKKTSKSKISAKKTTKSQVNKSQFIRDNPSLSVPELIAKAKKAGFELSPAFIYTLRSEARKKQGKATKAISLVGKPHKTGPSGSVEQQFVAAILEMGASRAEQLFRTTVNKVRALAK